MDVVIKGITWVFSLLAKLLSFIPFNQDVVLIIACIGGAYFLVRNDRIPPIAIVGIVALLLLYGIKMAVGGI